MWFSQLISIVSTIFHLKSLRGGNIDFADHIQLLLNLTSVVQIRNMSLLKSPIYYYSLIGPPHSLSRYILLLLPCNCTEWRDNNNYFITRPKYLMTCLLQSYSGTICGRFYDIKCRVKQEVRWHKAFAVIRYYNKALKPSVPDTLQIIMLTPSIEKTAKLIISRLVVV